VPGGAPPGGELERALEPVVPALHAEPAAGTLGGIGGREDAARHLLASEQRGVNTLGGQGRGHAGRVAGEMHVSRKMESAKLYLDRGRLERRRPDLHPHPRNAPLEESAQV
jgi:hypothetical protein